jgi:hypothetical protein
MEEKKERKPWTAEEEEVLLKQVNAFPQNLTKCFLIVSEQIDRTPGAISNHWYTKLSKDPKVLVFATISPKHVSKNRKNGMGVASTNSIWKRFCKLIKTLFE